MTRIIYYYQTFTSLQPILYKNTPITHIHLSSIHFGKNPDKSHYIHLNDYEPYNQTFDTVWDELLEAGKYNITTILMVGGAGGAFQHLFSDYQVYYSLLKELISKKKIIKGIDLDVEEYVDIENIKMLINDIKKDFGDDFIITMAPIQSSLQTDYPGMGGFIYKDLYNSPDGKLIDYFNVQFYEDYSENAYTQVIENNYPSNKIVMGMISGEEFENELKKTYQKYGNNFGGVFIWEYSNSLKNWLNTIINILNI